MPLSKPPVAVAPIMVSDRTCEVVFGTPWRALRSFCEEHKIAIGRIGRRPVVAVAAVMSALDGGAPDWDEAAVIASAASGR